MPKFAAKVDRNQPEIVKALRQAGASVAHMHTLGHGVPDVLAGHMAFCWNCQAAYKANTLMEIKDGLLSPSRRILTPAEAKFHESWRGQLVIVNSIEQALAAIGVKVK